MREDIGRYLLKTAEINNCTPFGNLQASLGSSTEENKLAGDADLTSKNKVVNHLAHSVEPPANCPEIASTAHHAPGATRKATQAQQNAQRDISLPNRRVRAQTRQEDKRLANTRKAQRRARLKTPRSGNQNCTLTP